MTIKSAIRSGAAYRLAALALAVSALLWISPAIAQTTDGSTAGGATGGSMPVEDIRDCLCLQPRLQPLQDAWATSQRQLQEEQNQLANVDQQVTAQRQKLDPNDLVGQQVLKDLLAQQQQLREAIRAQFMPAANQTRDAYNAAVTEYNGKCIRPRYSVDEATARQNLVCPAQ
ncbi:MAG TPA: hypothetical protein VGM59_04615 [Dongiaceae bacterium]|jgi:uncharacterized membrane protein YdfJ with MMPL/SSD domain